jgi:hypothetical protein
LLDPTFDYPVLAEILGKSREPNPGLANVGQLELYQPPSLDDEIDFSTENLIRVNLDVPFSSPVLKEEVDVAYLDLSFTSRLVVGAGVRREKPSVFYPLGRPQPTATTPRAVPEWRYYSTLNTRFSHYLDVDELKSAISAYRSLEASGATGRHSASRTLNGICLGAMNNIQIRLNPGSTIEVYDEHEFFGSVAPLKEDGKIGEVWWLDFDTATGRLVQAHMQQTSSRIMVPIPFDDLDYDDARKCFVLRILPKQWKGPILPHKPGIRPFREGRRDYRPN